MVRLARAALIGILIAFSLLKVIALIVATTGSGIYDTDLLDTYVAVRAMAEGADPYRGTVYDAANRYTERSSLHFQHPSARSPMMALTLRPLAWFSYQRVAQLWLVAQFAALWVAILLLFRMFSFPNRASTRLMLWLMVIGWTPVVVDLMWLNLNTLLLALLAAALYAYTCKRPLPAGLFLGASVLFKPTAWPLIPLFLLRRESVVAGSAIGTAVAGTVVTAFVAGPDLLSSYAAASSSISHLFRNHPENQSLWTIGPRLFEGIGTELSLHPQLLAPPFYSNAAWASILRYLLPLAVLTVGLIHTRRMKDGLGAVSVMLGIAVLVSPLSWLHYSPLLLIPALWATARLRDMGWPRGETVVGGLLLALFIIEPLRTRWLMGKDFIVYVSAPVHVSAAWGLLTLYTAVLFAALTLWVAWIDSSSARIPVMAASIRGNHDVARGRCGVGAGPYSRADVRGGM